MVGAFFWIKVKNEAGSQTCLTDLIIIVEYKTIKSTTQIVN